MSGAILSLNSGSSSIKFGLFTIEPDGPCRTVHGKIEGIGTAPHLVVRETGGTILIDRALSAGNTHDSLLGLLIDLAIEQLPQHRLAAVGHRVVHGGPDFSQPQVVDDALLDALDALSRLAPLHQPHNVAAIRALRARRPDVPQIACFDTEFHTRRPAVAKRYAVPADWEARGIMSYGFHGISYEHIALTLAREEPELARGRVLVAHLGNGASLCAMVDGRSVDTTMGFSVIDGLMMGTRCGSLDPGVVLHMIREEGLSPDEVQATLYTKSGLLGVSGISSDMRVLQASSEQGAADAIALFLWRIVRELGALVAAMGGLDAIVFTGGIGENDAMIRSAICERLAWLGVRLDTAANEEGSRIIDTPGSAVDVRIIPADEEQMIAIHCQRLLALT